MILSYQVSYQKEFWIFQKTFVMKIEIFEIEDKNDSIHKTGDCLFIIWMAIFTKKKL